MGDTDDLVKEFLVESGENLDRLDQDFVAIEKSPGSEGPERLASIFRTIHTIKGTCGFLGFTKLEGVTHVGESLLSKLRDGELSVSSEIVSGLLAMVDAVREILANIESAGAEGNGEYSEIIANLTRLKDAGPAATVAADAATAGVPSVAVTQATGSAQEGVSVPLPPQPPSAGAIASTSLAATGESNDAATSDATAYPEGTKASESGTPSSPIAASGGIRVDVGLLDRLMNLVGELVLARNQIIQFSIGNEDPALAGSTQRLNLITTELQEGVMKTRMQPIGNVWSKFPRIVRDVAQLCGKRVRVEMEGRETELDKTIIESIKDPLTHIIRNSVDHGIEAPEARKAAGKPEEGCLFLRAFHEGGQVNIEIVDDGGGISLERVKRKAVERALITAEHAARMSDREATNLIFLPGFSTAEKVTNVSGRGVGMDVVRTNIEKIGGTVDVQSRAGQGTTLRIKIPLTLAIIPALVVTSAGDRFAIPQVSLLELVRLEADQARKGIEQIHGTPVYRLRGNLLPLVYLNKQLRTDGQAVSAGDGTVNIVVLQADERQFGLVVDEINDTEEIVVKPMGKLFKGLSTFAGATIMGDGKVALILDVMGLAQRSGVVSESKDRGMHDGMAQRRDSAGSKQTLLLFRLGGARRMALPLSQVARLEEIARDNVEYSGSQPAVQYRGQIMPLIWLSQVITDKEQSTGRPPSVQRDASAEPLHVIVNTKDGRSVGLIVDQIVDIVEESISVEQTNVRPGVLGSAVIDKKITELLDVAGAVEAAVRSSAGPRLSPRRTRNERYDHDGFDGVNGCGTAAPSGSNGAELGSLQIA